MQDIKNVLKESSNNDIGLYAEKCKFKRNSDKVKDLANNFIVFTSFNQGGVDVAGILVRIPYPEGSTVKAKSKTRALPFKKPNTRREIKSFIFSARQERDRIFTEIYGTEYTVENVIKAGFELKSETSSDQDDSKG